VFSLAQNLSKWERSPISEVNRVFSRAHPFPIVFVLQSMRWSDFIFFNLVLKSNQQEGERIALSPTFVVVLKP